jgi:hypothetical protein
MGRRKPKRLKTGDEPNEEVIVFKVRVKVDLTTTKKTGLHPDGLQQEHV